MARDVRFSEQLAGKTYIKLQTKESKFFLNQFYYDSLWYYYQADKSTRLTMDSNMIGFIWK